MHVCMYIRIIDGWMAAWMDGWMDGWMDACMDGWMDGWMHGLNHIVCMCTAGVRESRIHHKDREYAACSSSSSHSLTSGPLAEIMV